MAKTIVCCAMTGAQQGKEANPALPEQPDEIIEAGLAAWRAGASILHIHARDKSGKASSDVGTLRTIVDGLKEGGCDAVINLSTGGAVAGLPLEDRIRCVPEIKPDMASFSVGGGSLLGRYDERAGEWVGDRHVPLFGSHRELERVAKIFQDNNVRPELEIYHSGMLNNIAALMDRGVFDEPLFANIVMGIPGETTKATVKNLVYMVDGLPPGSQWLVSAIGAANHFRMMGAVVAMGGHVRVGLEDNVYISPGELASSNAQIVEKAVRILTETGVEVATPDDARQLLKLKRS